ncbi:MAG: hypothetical protein IKH28_02825 [Lachnospiraceae bacterium]|nr:hypothetical protein [Lachnospiraceae bacterium]
MHAQIPFSSTKQFRSNIPLAQKKLSSYRQATFTYRDCLDEIFQLSASVLPLLRLPIEIILPSGKHFFSSSLALKTIPVYKQAYALALLKLLLFKQAI